MKCKVLHCHPRISKQNLNSHAVVSCMCKEEKKSSNLSQSSLLHVMCSSRLFWRLSPQWLPWGPPQLPRAAQSQTQWLNLFTSVQWHGRWLIHIKRLNELLGLSSVHIAELTEWPNRWGYHLVYLAPAFFPLWLVYIVPSICPSLFWLLGIQSYIRCSFFLAEVFT